MEDGCQWEWNSGLWWTCIHYNSENAFSLFDTHGDWFMDCEKFKEILWGELDSGGIDMMNEIIQEMDADKVSSTVWNINNYVFLRIDISLSPM